MNMRFSYLMRPKAKWDINVSSLVYHIWIPKRDKVPSDILRAENETTDAIEHISPQPFVGQFKKILKNPWLSPDPISGCHLAPYPSKLFIFQKPECSDTDWSAGPHLKYQTMKQVEYAQAVTGKLGSNDLFRFKVTSMYGTYVGQLLLLQALLITQGYPYSSKSITFQNQTKKRNCFFFFFKHFEYFLSMRKAIILQLIKIFRSFYGK